MSSKPSSATRSSTVTLLALSGTSSVMAPVNALPKSSKRSHRLKSPSASRAKIDEVRYGFRRSQDKCTLSNRTESYRRCAHRANVLEAVFGNQVVNGDITRIE